MSKTTEFNRDAFMAEAKDLFEAAGSAPTKYYESYSGSVYRECPGTYCDHMVRAMAHDMVSAYLALKNTPFGERLQSWMPKMTTLNTEVMRMIDDFKGDRPVKGQNKKKWKKFMAEIEDIRRAPEVKTCGLNKLDKKMEMWSDRLAYQLAWIYFLRENHAIKYIKMQLGCTEDGSNVSPMTGLTKQEEKTVENICEIRQLLLYTYLKIPVNTPEHDECLEKLEDLGARVDNIMRHLTEEEPCNENEATSDNKGNEPYTDEDREKDAKAVKDVLTAIQTVAENIKANADPKYKSQKPQLKDRVITVKVLLSRLEQKMDDRDDSFPVMAKKTAEMLKKLADDIEMEVILS